MSFLVFVTVFCIGLIVGSFLNVCIIRGERGESIGGRSRCFHCKKTLSIIELVPVISFLLQKGRCRTCGAVLSLQYPLVELGTAIAYAGVFFFVRDTLAFSFSSFLFLLSLFVGIAAVMVIFVSDLRFTIIPDGALFVLFAVAVVALFLQPQSQEKTFITALIFSLLLFSLWFFSKGKWMGFGDVKLIFVTSLLAGYPASLIAFLFSFWLGGIAGIALLVSGNTSLKSKIPFGPFILAGTLLAYFLTEQFLQITGLTILL